MNNKADSFYGCSGLATVHLGDGLEDDGEEDFWECTALQQIVIPPTIKVIEAMTFYGCGRLMTVNLCNGPWEIGRGAFQGCLWFQQVVTHPAVKAIKACVKIARS